MKVKTIPSAWMRRDGRRFDCGPYMSGALEAKIRLEELACRKDRLADVCDGGIAGLVNAGRITRQWAADSVHGVPFLTSTSILQADLSDLRFISHRAVRENPKLIIRAGYTLITRAGTIGRMSYARPDMDGLACTEDVLRVIPDDRRVRPGYLYAFLSSKFGVPLVTSGTYGAIIQHIEPQHIADLPVPRLGDEVEREVHMLVEEAANLRTEALQSLDEVQRQLDEVLGLPDLRGHSVSEFSVGTVSSQRLNNRFDSPYHSAAATRALEAIERGPHPVRQLSSVLRRYFKPPMFKRLWVDSPEYGRQFISGVDAYRFQAESVRYVSKKTPNFDEFVLEEGSVIFQAAGQIYGLFGTPLFVSGWLVGLFAADDLYRLVPQTPEDGGYLFAYLRTPVGQLLLKRQACGNSIPRVWDPHIRDMTLPWPDASLRRQVGKAVIDAHADLERARVAENEAVALVERAIEEAA